MGTTQTESLELTSAPGRVGQAPGNSQAREEASQSPVVISKDELPKPVLPAPEEERGDLAGSGQGGGGWGCRLRGRGHAGPRPRGEEREPAGAGTLGWGGTRGPGSESPRHHSQVPSFSPPVFRSQGAGSLSIYF